MRSLPRRDREGGDIVLGWLVRVSVVLALFGVVCFDAIAIAVASVRVTDDAGTAAAAAADAWRDWPDVQTTYDAATEALEPGATVLTTGFTIRRDGSVQLRVRRQASTLVVGAIGPLRRYTRATAVGRSRPGG